MKFSNLEDMWKHRSTEMSCEKCMYFVRKVVKMPNGEKSSNLGRCRRHSPSVSQGWPAIFSSDWCGDHKLDENKI